MSERALEEMSLITPETRDLSEGGVGLSDGIARNGVSERVLAMVGDGGEEGRTIRKMVKCN